MNATLTSSSEKIVLRSQVVNLGRASDNQIVVNDPKVFPYHAQIRLEAQGYCIIDLGSNNGTSINEQLLRPNVPYLLRSGDIIRLGVTRFRYDAHAVTQVISPSNGNGTNWRANSMAMPPAQSSRSPHTIGNQSPGFTAPTTAAGSTSSVRASSPYPTYTLASLFWKENRKTLWLTIGITAVGLLVSFLIFTSLHSPGRMLDTACNALKSGDYQTVYNQFAPGVLKETDLTTIHAVSCSYSSLNTTGDTATATVSITMATGQTVTYQIDLIQDSSFDWKIYYAQAISN